MPLRERMKFSFVKRTLARFYRHRNLSTLAALSLQLSAISARKEWNWISPRKSLTLNLETAHFKIYRGWMRLRRIRLSRNSPT